MASDDDRDRLSFPDFPDDVQLSILSFLPPSQLAIFCCTSKRFYSLYSSPDSPLWSSLCRRRFSPITRLDGWGRGRIPSKHLYSALSDLDSLTGFWRPCGNGDGLVDAHVPSLLLVEWGPSFLLGSRVYPSREGSYDVVKSPFLWMFLSERGRRLCFVDTKGRGLDSEKALVDLVDGESGLVAVNVSSLGCKHLLVEDSEEPGRRSDGISSSGSSSGGSFVGDDGEEGSGDDVAEAMAGLPDSYTKEMYQHFANRMSPGSRGVWRRQRRRERERKKKRFDELHFVRVGNCSPTVSRPLQGLWKGIGSNLKLGFYLVTYDDFRGIKCQKVGESNSSSPGFTPVLWMAAPTSQELKFSSEEVQFSDSWTSLPLLMSSNNRQNHPLVENEIWQYMDGMLRFGFLTDSLIIDLKHVTEDGSLLDLVTSSGD
ncbi:hypothetical protein MLD38_001715 [Melastoma candidum]|uniref:Uncharacterized protein n=1 Tax=Melastoma candidum TaxID=119954 RepID=A0ACB9SJ12_9MYRT|nr:hypothetical protein MLD38_001715 [Melastoma candidum]